MKTSFVEEGFSLSFFRVHAHMVHKVSVAGESFVAYTALVWFFSSVDTDMLPKRATLIKPSSANETCVRLFTSMCSHMSDERVTLREFFRTHAALKRTLASMYSHMSNELAAVAKIPLACVAVVDFARNQVSNIGRFRSIVCHLVHNHVDLLVERPLAHVADEGLLVRFRKDMFLQLHFTDDALVTYITAEQFFPRMLLAFLGVAFVFTRFRDENIHFVMNVFVASAERNVFFFLFV